MKFAPGTSQAQMAAVEAKMLKRKSDMKAAARGDVKQAVMPGRGMPASAPKPKPNMPIRGVGTNQLRGAPQSKQLQFLSDKLRGGMGKPTFMSDQLRGAGTPQRQNTQSVMNAAMSGAGATPQRTQGLGTGMGTGMNKMAGAGAALGKAFGAKKGGKVSSKMGAVKTSAKPDGIAQRGKTNCKMR
jgi:hypothetical protein